MSPHHHAPELPYCRNCHFTLAVPRPIYCGHCGQETDLHPPSVREMFTEYLGHYVALDGPLWRTLWALICLPGHLTNAYFHGKRRWYVLPLRVYLSASFVFFVGWALLPPDAQPVSVGDAQVEKAIDDAVDRAEQRGEEKLRVKRLRSPAELAAAAASAAGREKSDLDAPLGCRDDTPENCNAIERGLSHLITKFASIPTDKWGARFRALAPYGMLTMQPVFAALLLVLFAGRGRRYAEHFVFSLHSHSLWFLALLLAFVAEGLAGWLTLAVFMHGVVALRRVYGLGWSGAFWRGLLLSAGYFVLLLAVLVTFAAGVALLA